MEDFVKELKRWQIYLFNGKINTKYPHYKVVLNSNVSSETYLIFLSIATSQVKKRKEFIKQRWLNPKTLVIIKPDKVACLSMETCFDCNSIVWYNIHELYWFKLEWKLMYKWDMPDNIMEKIIEWVKISELISPYEKDIVW